MSGSVVLPEPTSASMPMASVTTEAWAYAQGLGHHIRPGWCPRVMLLPEPNRLGCPALPPGGHGDVQVVARGHVWVCDPNKARISVDIHGSCYHQGSYNYPILHPPLPSLGYHLGLCWNPEITLLLGPCQSERPMLPPRAMVPYLPKLLLLVTSRSTVLLQLGSVLMSVAHVSTGTYKP